jgi:MFS family permease
MIGLMILRLQLRPLRDVNFRRFYLGEIINTAGSSMAGIALAFAVLHIENSATTLGWVVAAWTIPMVAFMLIGGAAADRFPRAVILRGCNLVQGVAQALAAGLVLTDTAEVWHLILIQFVSGTAFAASYPAFHGMVPILLGEEDRKSGYLLINQTESALRILGPAVAGVLIAVSSPGWGLAFDAATYFGAAYFLTRLELPMGARPNRQESVIGDFRAGWALARQLGWVLPVALCSLVYNALTSGGLNVLGPAIANDSIGSTGWGIGRAAEALGLFLFSIVLVRFTIRRPMIVIQVGFLTTALPMLALGLLVTTPMIAAAFFVVGCGMAALHLSWSLAVQEKVPEDMLSRIMAIDGFFSFVAMPIGQLAIGPVEQAIGSSHAEIACAALVAATFAVGVTRRPLRALRLNGVPSSDSPAEI